jgi:hypothetical protein
VSFFFTNVPVYIEESLTMNHSLILTESLLATTSGSTKYRPKSQSGTLSIDIKMPPSVVLGSMFESTLSQLYVLDARKPTLPVPLLPPEHVLRTPSYEPTARRIAFAVHVFIKRISVKISSSRIRRRTVKGDDTIYSMPSAITLDKSWSRGGCCN